MTTQGETVVGTDELEALRREVASLKAGQQRKARLAAAIAAAVVVLVGVFFVGRWAGIAAEQAHDVDFCVTNLVAEGFYTQESIESVCNQEPGAELESADD